MDSKPYAAQGRKLKAYRILANITQSDLSKETGIPLGTYKQYEQGRCLPGSERLIQIMIRLNIPAVDLADVLGARRMLDAVPEPSELAGAR